MIAGLLRPVWTWALWSWRRLGLTVCLVLAVGFAAVRITHAADPSTAPAHAPVAPAHHSHAADAPASPSTAAPGDGGSGLGAALTTGEQFAAAWVSHAPGWERQARKYATRALATRLTAAAQPGWHAAAVTGPAAAAGEQSPGSITVTVPTTAGVALITVVQSADGWLVSAARFTGAGH